MSGYEKIQFVKKEVEAFKNAELYSLCNEENAVIVRNTNTGCLYHIPYEMNEDTMSFDCANATKVKERDESAIDEFEKNSNALKNAMKSIFEDVEKYEENITNLKKLVRELPAVDPETLKTISKKEEVVEEPYKGILEEQVRAYKTAEKELTNSTTLFDENDELVNTKVSISQMNAWIAEKAEVDAEFDAIVEQYAEFKNQLSNTIEDADVAKAILEGVDISENISKSVPKTLVLAKNKLNKDINIIETTKQVVELWKTSFTEDGITPSLKMDKIYNYAQNDRERPTFLKFKSGIFKVEDLITLLEELDRAMADRDINADELMFIANQKAAVEYMFRTQKLSDKKIMQIIEEFNKRFSAEQGEEDYLQSQLGWKDKDSMKLGNVTGYVQRTQGDK